MESLQFSELPLMEACIRFSFAAPIDVSLRSAAALVQARTEFSELAAPEGFEAPPGIPTLQLPEPGHWGFVVTNKHQGISVTAHPQLLAARWTRGKVPYPRFPALRDALHKIMEALRMMGAVAGPVAIVNMSYVNFVELVDGVTLADYFSRAFTVDAFSRAKEIQDFNLAWRERDDIDLRVRAQRAEAQFGPESKSGFQLTTVGGRALRGSDDAARALDEIHDRLQNMFSELISERAKREWGYGQTDVR